MQASEAALKVVGNKNPSGSLSGRVFDPDGISPTVMENHGYPVLIAEDGSKMNEKAKVNQIANLIGDRPGKFPNPIRGRVLGVDGVSPCLNACGGGNLEPKILVHMDTRLEGMLASGKVPMQDGAWIDTYNKTASTEVSGTLTTTVSSSNVRFVTDLKQRPLNTTSDGLAFTITTRYGAICASNLEGGAHYPMTGVLVEGGKGPAQMICVNAKADGRQPSIADRVYSADGVFATITTGWRPNVLEEGGAVGCAVRGRGDGGERRQELEMGCAVANSITTVQKDSMVAVIQKVGDRGTSSYSVHDYSNALPANPMSDRGQLLAEIAEAPTRQERIGYCIQADGAIRGYDTAKGTPMSEEQYCSPAGLAPTITVKQRARVIDPSSPKLALGMWGGAQTDRVYDADGTAPTLVAQTDPRRALIAEPMVMHDPRKSFGRATPSGEASPALLSTDYKSPHLVMENEKDKETQASAAAASCFPQVLERPPFTEESLHVYNMKCERIGVDVEAFAAAYHWFLAQIAPWSDGITRVVLADDMSHVYPLSVKPLPAAQPRPRLRIRKLTPRECFRLMDVDDDRIDMIEEAGISNSQQYKLAGNSIVVSCMHHIFKNLFGNDEAPLNQQLSLF